MSKRIDVKQKNFVNINSVLKYIVSRSKLNLKSNQLKRSPDSVIYDDNERRLLSDKNETDEITNSSFALTPSTSIANDINFNNLSDLPTFEQFSYKSNDSKLKEKFLRDVKIGDKIIAQIVGVKFVLLEVNLICMKIRFRRCISVFMPYQKFFVPYDRSKNIYQVNYYVTVCVKAIELNERNKELKLEIDENEGIFESIDQLPLYYRNYLKFVAENQEFNEEISYDDSKQIKNLSNNVNLGKLLMVDIECSISGLNCFENKFLQQEKSKTADLLRFMQNRRLAMTHVERGAELTRAGQCFEAIQCFNKALNIDEHFADAYVGRGAACAGCENFSAALCDLEKAIELEANHKNAIRYRIEILIAYGKSLEKEGKFQEAYEKYNRALKLSENINERALNALKRVELLLDENTLKTLTDCKKKNNYKTDIDVVYLSDKSEEDEIKRNKTDTEQKLNKHLKKRSLSKLQSDDFSKKKYAKIITNNEKNLKSVQNRGYLNKSDCFNENRRKLKEMEDFIAELKKTK